MKRIPLPLWITIIILSGLLLSSVVAQPGAYNISAWVVASGGGGSTGGAYGLDGTIGQSTAGRISSGTYSIESGYWGLDDSIVRPGGPVYLPMINRAIPVPTATRTPRPTRTPTPTPTVGLPPPCGDTSNNSTPSLAGPLLVINNICSGSLGISDQEDWYVFSMNTGQSFTIRLSHKASEDYDIYMAGPDKRDLYVCVGTPGGICNATGTGTVDVVSGTVVQSGSYYFMVYGATRNGPDYRYELTVTRP